MAAASDRSDPAYPSDLRKALDDVMAAFGEHVVANDKCAAAADECTTAANKFIAAAKTYMAAYADLEISIVQLKAIIKCAADIPGAPPAHIKAMLDITLGFYNATIKAHEAIVRVSNATEEAMATYHAKNEALCAVAPVLGSKGNIVGNKLAIFDAKLKEASRVLPKHEVAALRAKVVAAAAYHDVDKAKIAIAEQFAAAEAVELVEKRCADMTATRDAVENDVKTAVNRMHDVFEKHFADIKAVFGTRRPPGS